MRYIKPFFENVHTERIENEYYRFVPWDEIPKREPVPWTEEEIETIKTTFNFPETIWMRVLGRMQSEPSVHLFVSWDGLRRPDLLIINLPKYILKVYKKMDSYGEQGEEWYHVKIDGQYGTMMKTSVSNWEYECDQLEGLLELIGDISKKPRVI